LKINMNKNIFLFIFIFKISPQLQDQENGATSLIIFHHSRL